MKIPIKTFEEMNAQERREYLEGLLDDGSNLTVAEITEILQALRASEEFQSWNPSEADGIPSAYTPQQVAKAWNVSGEFVRLLFMNEPGVLRFNKTGKSSKTAREYTTIRIPKPVMLRVYKKWQKITRRIK
jgi:hypothetical protein